MARKKTVVTETIQRRSPKGKLLSESKTRTVFFDGIPEAVARPPSPRPPVPHRRRPSVLPSDCESQTEIVEFRRYGDCADYFDDWDTAVVREARLVRTESPNPAPALTQQRPNELKMLYERINLLRRRHDVAPLRRSPALEQEARDWARQMLLDGRVRAKSLSNVWLGPRADLERVPDEWNVEMRAWRRHHFQCAGIRDVGVAVVHRGAGRDCVVVALYS